MIANCAALARWSVIAGIARVSGTKKKGMPAPWISCGRASVQNSAPLVHQKTRIGQCVELIRDPVIMAAFHPQLPFGQVAT